MGKSAVAVVVCMSVLLFLAMATEVRGTCPGVLEYMPCLTAAQNQNVNPTQACCNVIAQEGRQPDGPACLCEMAHQTGYGTQFAAAVHLVQKCGLPNPTGYVCH